VNATSRLTTRRTDLLMATHHDTGGGAAVPLHLPDPQVKILRGTIASCLEGVSGDLRKSEQLPDPERAQREASAYQRLLAALDSRRIVLPDDAVREAVEIMVLAIEEDTDYRRLVAEHDALFGLLDLLGGVKVEMR
jgi:hypothetical protein